MTRCFTVTCRNAMALKVSCIIHCSMVGGQEQQIISLTHPTVKKSEEALDIFVKSEIRMPSSKSLVSEVLSL